MSAHLKRLKTHSPAFFQTHLEFCLPEATNAVIRDRIRERELHKGDSASWLREQRIQIEALEGEYWKNVSAGTFAGIAHSLRMLTDKDSLWPSFVVDQVLGLSFPPTTFERIILRVSSLEIVKALLARKEDYEYMRLNHGVELTRSRSKR